MTGLFDRRSVFQVIGGLLQNPSLLDEYVLTQEDFNGDSFHQVKKDFVVILRLLGKPKIGRAHV